VIQNLAGQSNQYTVLNVSGLGVSGFVNVQTLQACGHNHLCRITFCVSKEELSIYFLSGPGRDVFVMDITSNDVCVMVVVSAWCFVSLLM
jgi:hypothetical protein